MRIILDFTSKDLIRVGIILYITIDNIQYGVQRILISILNMRCPLIGQGYRVSE